MITVNKKTYNDSYLYNLDANKHNQMLTEFILNSDRIEDKKSKEFFGIAEDVRRTQRSNVLYNLLFSDDIVLCVGKKELPRAFKVFMAKDIKDGKNGKRKIFIDVTELIVFKNGFYSCRNIGYLDTYLFQALCYYIYDRDTMKVVNNSTINKAGADAYASMFCYVIDYLRIIGYEQSRTKITYLAALFYLHSLLGKDLDQYSKNVAANIAGVNPSISNAWDMYYEEKDFMDIDTFITMIAGTFKLKGLNTEVFIGEWNHSFSRSTTYACELFTNFVGVLVATYSGAYIVNQRQIERCCTKSMIAVSTEILKIGSQSLGVTESLTPDDIRDISTITLRESLLKKNKAPEDTKYTDEDFADKSKALAKTKALIKWYTENDNVGKLDSKIHSAITTACGMAGLWVNDKGEYAIGVTEAIVKTGAKYLNERSKKSVKTDFNKTIASLEKTIDKANEAGNKSKVKKAGEFKLELTKCIRLI